MNKAEKILVVIAAALVLLTLGYFALPQPQAEFAQATAAPAQTASPEERLDINSATAEQLQQLPGIGPTLAERIVNWRDENGPYESPEDLMAVNGIGEGRLSAIMDYICCKKEAP